MQSSGYPGTGLQIASPPARGRAVPLRVHHGSEGLRGTGMHPGRRHGSRQDAHEHHDYVDAAEPGHDSGGLCSHQSDDRVSDIVGGQLGQ